MSSQAPTQELTVQDILMLFQESERRAKEDHARFEHEMRESQAVWDHRMAAWDRRIQQMNKQLSRLGDDIGHFAESMVEPAISRLFTARGIEINRVMPRITCRTSGLEMEIDLLGVDKDYAVVVEVKTRLKQSDVDEHLERLALFKAAFPEYATKHVFGVVAGMDVPENVAKYAYRQGLFVLAQSGEVLEVLNDDQFQPRAW